MRRSIAVAVAVVCASVAFASDAPRPHLKTPDYLPPLARRLLRTRMARHGDDMVRLMLAVTLLQRDQVRSLATDIANEPRLTRPIAGGADDLNAALPMQLFNLQDELRQRAKDLAAAAGSRASDQALAASFGKMTETCVACHSAYLNPPSAIDDDGNIDGGERGR